MRRFVLPIVAAIVLVALVLPTTAVANGWTVKNRSGVKIGKVVRTKTSKCVLYDKAGRRCGAVQWNAEVPTYVAYLAYAGDSGVRKMCRVEKTGGYWYITETLYWGGWALKKGDRWSVYQFGDGGVNRLRGRVSSRCPGWGAAGAVYVLTKTWL